MYTYGNTSSYAAQSNMGMAEYVWWSAVPKASMPSAGAWVPIRTQASPAMAASPKMSPAFTARVACGDRSPRATASNRWPSAPNACANTGVVASPALVTHMVVNHSSLATTWAAKVWKSSGRIVTVTVAGADVNSPSETAKVKVSTPVTNGLGV